MALTFTIAGLQAELDAWATAMSAADWETARKEAGDYYATRTGLVDNAAADGATFTLPLPKPSLYEQIDAAKLLYAQSVSRTPRVVLGRTGFRVPR